MGKSCFLQDLPELRDSLSVNTARICMSNKPILDTNRQKKNKNHLKPISGQGSARTASNCAFEV